jgi:Icc protein
MCLASTTSTITVKNIAKDSEKTLPELGWHSFDQKGVHFTGLVNVANIQEGGLGTLGQEQLDWLEKDVKSLSTSTPIVLFVHIPFVGCVSSIGLGN